MKPILFLLTLFLSADAFCQEDDLVSSLWCFDKNFQKSLKKGDTLEVHKFYMDNSPIKFTPNGKFKRIKAPVRMCGNAPKSKKIDQLRGKWAIRNNKLIMLIKSRTLSFTIVEMNSMKMILFCEGV